MSGVIVYFLYWSRGQQLVERRAAREALDISLSPLDGAPLIPPACGHRRSAHQLIFQSSSLGYPLHVPTQLLSQLISSPSTLCSAIWLRSRSASTTATSSNALRGVKSCAPLRILCVRAAFCCGAKCARFSAPWETRLIPTRIATAVSVICCVPRRRTRQRHDQSSASAGRLPPASPTSLPLRMPTCTAHPRALLLPLPCLARRHSWQRNDRQRLQAFGLTASAAPPCPCLRRQKMIMMWGTRKAFPLPRRRRRLRQRHRH